MTSDKTKIRNAATVIVIRNKCKNPSVLMGQRGVNAAFMPSKFVFPGGAVDDHDLSIDIKKSINEVCKKISLSMIGIIGICGHTWYMSDLFYGHKYI